MTLPIRIAPSLLSADFARLGEEVKAIEQAGADLIHFDVMDNHYVPNLTVGPMVCKAVKKHANIPIDVHLMVEPVDSLAAMFAEAGASIISFHPEASRHIDRTIKLIHSHGCQAGIALNPATPLNCLDHLLDQLDLILLMSVNPGFGGQTFIPSTLAKLTQVRHMVDRHMESGGNAIAIEVDGGVHLGNIASIAQAGADTFVAGSAVFSAVDENGGYSHIIEQLQQAAAGG